MGETKEKIKDAATKVVVPSPTYVFVQCAMLFSHYGLQYRMPWWVVWFPTLVYVILLSVLLLILLFVMAIAVFTD